MKTSQLFAQDNYNSISLLYSFRFDSVKAMAAKRPAPMRPTLNNPTLKNPKHLAVLQENNINYDQPLNPMQVAAVRAERIARDKKANATQNVSGVFSPIQPLLSVSVSVLVSWLISLSVWLPPPPPSLSLGLSVSLLTLSLRVSSFIPSLFQSVDCSPWPSFSFSLCPTCGMQAVFWLLHRDNHTSLQLKILIPPVTKFVGRVWEVLWNHPICLSCPSMWWWWWLAFSGWHRCCSARCPVRSTGPDGAHSSGRCAGCHWRSGIRSHSRSGCHWAAAPLPGVSHHAHHHHCKSYALEVEPSTLKWLCFWVWLGTWVFNLYPGALHNTDFYSVWWYNGSRLWKKMDHYFVTSKSFIVSAFEQ